MQPNIDQRIQLKIASQRGHPSHRGLPSTKQHTAGDHMPADKGKETPLKFEIKDGTLSFVSPSAGTSTRVESGWK